MTTEKKLTRYPSIDKPWLKYYSEEVISAPLPECSIYEYLLENNKNFANGIAINYYGRKITYNELFNNIDLAAKGFSSLGVRTGDIVTIFSTNTPETIYTIFALNRIGAIANLEYVTESEKEAVSSVIKCNSHVVVILDILLQKFLDVANSEIVEKVVLLPLSASMPPFKKIFFNIQSSQIKIGKGIPYYLMTQRGIGFQDAAYKKNRPAVIVHSGGTTGTPKGVVHSNESLNYIAWAFKHNGNDTKRGDRWLCVIPPFHAFGLAMGIIWPLSQGMQLILAIRYTEQELINLFLKHHPEHLMASGAHIPCIQANIKIQKMDLSFFKTCGFGGTPLSMAKEKELVEFLQGRNSMAKASVGYGMSETCSAVCTELNRYYGKLGSVGIPLEKVNVKVLDTDSLEELTYEQTGELCFSTPGLMLEYFENRKETEAAFFTDEDGTQWIHTGDMGYVDEDGFVYITGRIKRIYSTRAEKAGALFKIFPDYIASVVSEIGSVKDCAVVCIEDSNYKSIAIAYVILKDHADEMSVRAEIISHMKDCLPKHSVPKKICFVDTFPLTPIGKVDYRALEKEAEEMYRR